MALFLYIYRGMMHPALLTTAWNHLTPECRMEDCLPLFDGAEVDPTHPWEVPWFPLQSSFSHIHIGRRFKKNHPTSFSPGREQTFFATKEPQSLVTIDFWPGKALQCNLMNWKHISLSIIKNYEISVAHVSKPVATVENTVIPWLI